MTMSNLVALPGSDRDLKLGASQGAAADPNEAITVSLFVRRRTDSGPAPVGILSRAEHAAFLGADPADLAAVTAYAAASNLTVVEEDAAKRRIKLTGTVADFMTALNVALHQYDLPDGTSYRGRTGSVHVPPHLVDIVESIHGLDNREAAQTHFRKANPPQGHIHPHAAGTSFTPPQVAALYNYPAGLTGAGQTVAIIELGGGYKQDDLDTYFSGLKIATPSITAVPVDGGANTPSGDDDGEVLLDIEIVGSIAPGAKQAVYFAPNTDQGFIDGIADAVHDTVNKPSVISISWGGPENTWTAQTMQSMDQVFQDAAALGITVTVAAGDDLSTDGQTDGQLHVDFPASSPHVLACGGTKLTGSGNTIASESVWNEGANGGTGAGISAQFPLPDYQQGIGAPVAADTGKPGRAVCDITGNGDPQSGYQVRVDGKNDVYGGTSAVAPLWAALVARMNEILPKPVGNLNPLLKAAAAAGAFNDVTAGNNNSPGQKGYAAGPGWDVPSGWGSPNGAALLTFLEGVQKQQAPGPAIS